MNIFSEIKNFIHRYHFTRQAFSFLIVGICGTIISYSSFIIFLRLFHLYYLVANLGGFICSIGFSYYCNRRWTFKAQESKHFRRYFSFYVISFFLSSLLLKFFVDFCGIIPEIASILNIAIMTCFNFLGVKFLVFKK
ncbi:MAG: GtrA family protein [Proteobacteria bacterium]|nr:GtrA family protein [Pseudomonadota bacterium]